MPPPQGPPQPGPTPAPALVFRAPREWSRVHPISPLLGGWPIIGIVATIVLYRYVPDWLSPDEMASDFARRATSAPLWFALGALVVLVLAVGFGYLQWRVHKYKLGDEAVHQRTGILFRQQRQARLDRLQAVDVVQPLLARLFGFAALKIEVAGGEDSGVSLEYLRLGDAEAMRNELLAIAAGVKRAKAQGEDATADAVAAHIADGTHTDVQYAGKASLKDVSGGGVGVAETAAAPERQIYRVPVGRLVTSIMLTGPFLVIVSIPVVIGIAVLSLPFDLDDVLAIFVGTSLATALPALAGLVGFFWVRFNTGFGFTAALSQDGIRLRHGALETRRQTVPPGRVQAVRFHQGLLWRRKDWWRVTINVAGYQENQEAVSTLLPVGTRQDALTALWLVLPDLGDPDPAGTVSKALSGTGAEGGFTASSKRARVFDPIQWRQRGVRATDRALLIRRGRFTREMFVVPHERTQSLQLKQGVLQRWRSLATFVVNSTNGPVKPVAQHLDVEDALALIESQSKRAAEGRRRQTPEQWMSAVGLADEPTTQAGASDSA